MTNKHPLSDHFDGERFLNPGVETDKRFADIWRWRRTSRRTPWPASVANRQHPPAPATIERGQVAVTFIGHATMLVRFERATVLFDPFFSERASPFAFAGPKRVRPPGIPLADLPRLDALCLSHNHYDHMDIASLRRLMKGPGDPPVVTGLGNKAFLEPRGVAGAIELDWWQETTLGPDLTITFTPAQHWSSRTLADRRRTLWGGFWLRSGGVSLYFAGDSGYCGWFKTIRERLGPPDLAILPIGAYAPRWFMRDQHMDPTEAVAAFRDLQAPQAIGMHFGTIQLTDEGIDEPVLELAKALAAAGLPPERFLALDIGETRVLSAGG